MAEQVYDFGDIARLSVNFKVNGVLTNPTAVTATVRQPDGTTTAYAYNPGDITNDGVGLYHLDVTVAHNGEWSYKFVGTGAAADVGTGIFYVRPDPTADDPHLYVSVDAIKEALTLTGQTNLDPLIAERAETASRAIDIICGRRFYSDTEPRYFTAGCYDSGIEVGDVLSVTTLTVDMDGDGVYETAWTEGTDFYLDPANAQVYGQPFTTLRLRRQRRRRFPIYDRAIKMEGVFGWDRAPAQVRAFAEILTRRLVSRSRDQNQVLGLVLSGNDLGSVTRLARTDPDFDLLLGDFVIPKQLIA